MQWEREDCGHFYADTCENVNKTGNFRGRLGSFQSVKWPETRWAGAGLMRASRAADALSPG